MLIQVIDRQTDLVVSPDRIKKLVTQVLDEEKCVCDEINLYLVTPQEISDLHRDYFDDDSPTDCISFPMDSEDDFNDGYRILGDVFVCPKTAIDYAKMHKLPPYDELALYIVHGLLHLMGYDDLEDDVRQKMRQAEARHMGRLKELGITLDV